ncbi:MAG: pentapeptide repeat-containing protein [Acaryochloris sp. CRU_2_0]|nr:pentapeptide repeat-containing protein [Acaryochloris sp. CRU_2_0]
MLKSALKSDLLLRANTIGLDQAAVLIGLDQETILGDLGSNLLVASRVNGQWYFDRNDLCAYAYHYYHDKDEQYESITSYLTPQVVLKRYTEGEKDFSCQAIVNDADFASYQLPSVDFYYSKLCGVNFEGANLKNADFREANLFKASMKNANLSGVAFQGADLRAANFSGADLTNACFWDAKLDNVNLEGVIIKNTQFWRGIPLTKL